MVEIGRIYGSEIFGISKFSFDNALIFWYTKMMKIVRWKLHESDLIDIWVCNFSGTCKWFAEMDSDAISLCDKPIGVVSVWWSDDFPIRQLDNQIKRWRDFLKKIADLSIKSHNYSIIRWEGCKKSILREQLHILEYFVKLETFHSLPI